MPRFALPDFPILSMDPLRFGFLVVVGVISSKSWTHPCRRRERPVRSCRRDCALAASGVAFMAKRPLRTDLVACGLLFAGLLVALSIFSFDPADPPGNTVYPPRDVARNLLGPAGAW